MSISYMGEGNLSPEERKALDAYNKALHTLTLERGRKTKPWQLAQHAALRRLLLNGSCLIFKNPAQQALGKRRVYKGNKT
jgi:hypothetical protein